MQSMQHIDNTDYGHIWPSILNDAEIRFQSSFGCSLDGCRPYAAWRSPGEAVWRQGYADNFFDAKADDGSLQFSCRIEKLELTIVMRRLADEAWELSGQLSNIGANAVELARIHYLDGSVSSQDIDFIAPTEINLIYGRMYQSSDIVPSAATVMENQWGKQNNMSWPILSEPIHESADLAVSIDTGILTAGWDQPGWFFGFTGPGTAFGEVGYKAGQEYPGFFVGTLLDSILIESGQTRSLEKVVICYGDWQDSLRFWAQKCAEELGAIHQPHSLVGYCSWYQCWDKVAPGDIRRACEEFADFPAPPGGRTIQIDDGFQKAPGDWQANDTFKDSWESLPEEISKAGFIPGMWLGPTLIHETNSIVKEHPEWLQRLPDGEPALWFSNWGKTYYLEPDHPESQKLMCDLFRGFIAQGWRYFKVDFAYPLSTARLAYDRTKTSFESLRDMHRLFREACGEGVLINACIGQLGRFAIGTVQIARLGRDIGHDWATVKDNIMVLMLRICTNGLWWQADADVFSMRKENSTLSDEENYLLMGTVGLMGGVFLTSDFPSQWSEDAKEAVREFWTASGPCPRLCHYVLFSSDGTPEAYRVSYGDGNTPQHLIAVYNWDSEHRDVCISLEELRLKSGISWQLTKTQRNRDVQLANGSLMVKKQPPHSVRIAGLTEIC